MKDSSPLPAPAETTRAVALKSTLLLVAISLSAFEFFIPRIPIFPWMKPGLANCVTMLWIIRYGGVDALLLTLLRIWTVGFYFGFSFFTLMLSLSGGLAATAVMALLWRGLGRRSIMGIAGMSICGALAHNGAQLAVMFFVMMRNMYLLYQIPIMIFASVAFGVLVAMLVPLLDALADGMPDTAGGPVSHPAPAARPSIRDSMLCALVLAFCIGLLFITNLRALGAAALVVTAGVQVVERGSLRLLFRPLRRFWLLFIAVGAFHLMFSYGTRVQWVPLVTYEGLNDAAVQWLRLWTWLQVSALFTRLRFHLVFFHALHMLFRAQGETIFAGLIALERFPTAIDIIRANAAGKVSMALRNPVRWAREAVRRSFDEMALQASDTP